MKTFNRNSKIASKFVWLLVLLLFVQPLAGVELKEDKFDVLQIGAQSYTNVTVTTKGKTSIFITHASGMVSIKVTELSPDLRQKLGYEAPDAETPKVSTNSAAIWAKQTIAKIQTPEVKEAQQKMEERWRSYFPEGQFTPTSINKTILISAAATLALFYLFFCYCSMLICQKAGKESGLLIWVPFFQGIALLRAADMSTSWFLVYFVPIIVSGVVAAFESSSLLILSYLAFMVAMEVLGFIVIIVWCFKIAKARGKSAWVGLFLLLPITNLFAFLYLAFSDSAVEEAPKKTRLMAFEAV